MALPDPVVELMKSADVILHAGDLIDPGVLPMLQAHAPVHAVLGNNDRQLAGVLPERLEFDLDGLRVAMVHDSGARTGRPGRLRRWFPDAELVVFGHSHQPANEVGEAGQRLFNPGSPTERRRAPTHTCGLLEVDAGRVLRLQLVDLGS
jgi:putative phosphoesterase